MSKNSFRADDAAALKSNVVKDVLNLVLVHGDDKIDEHEHKDEEKEVFYEVVAGRARRGFLFF